ncbi:arginine deiminase family protein [Sphingomonas sp. BIUV-7]|uniref:arginine deiminase n=1 Tax=Sphingomonas natans TaxID=3063330 RepID=A0ABT8Y8V2_9SPHN|nr:arginine deiminase family protein [Sphingomonas sp. BIUV-7]MDO6414105.1 arginine deiminase family protein [Sphingomonas sp. BIUV-7]
MKLNVFDDIVVPIHSRDGSPKVIGDTARLREVVLCPPSYLAPVPCCSVTREKLRDGFQTDTELAGRQHRVLQRALERFGVQCHVIPAAPDMPDLSFTRDVAATTPWGLVLLNPAMPHRSIEVEHFSAAIERISGVPARRITDGFIEGGDVCVARPGLLIVGVSGDRTDQRGADAFARLFREQSWEVITYRFDPHFLHLDTIFCMLDDATALACTDVLDNGFLDQLEDRGIKVIPVSYKEARRLGCNVVSIDGKTIFTSDREPRVAEALRQSGYRVETFDISEFSACGGGIHCLTMPLARG